MDIDTILKIDFVKELISRVCGEDIEIVSRKNSFAVRKKKEEERDIHRIILLPPRGFTANSLEQMNSHDEADFATIEIKGAVKKDKLGFSKLKNCLLVASKNETGAVSELSQPYLTFDIQKTLEPDLTLKRHSAGIAPFPVVKNNGFGFYHNLINLTDDWLVLKLHKRLRPQKSVNLEPHLENLTSIEKEILENFYNSIVEHGDNIFYKAPDVISNILELPTSVSLPSLGEMLYVHDSGMHEACTVFGIILKIGNKKPDTVIDFLKHAKKIQAVPTYYAEQLIGKINNKRSSQNYISASKAA